MDYPEIPTNQLTDAVTLQASMYFPLYSWSERRYGILTHEEIARGFMDEFGGIEGWHLEAHQPANPDYMVFHVSGVEDSQDAAENTVRTYGKAIFDHDHARGHGRNFFLLPPHCRVHCCPALKVRPVESELVASVG